HPWHGRGNMQQLRQLGKVCRELGRGEQHLRRLMHEPLYSSCQEMLTTFKCTDPFLIQGGWCRQTCGYCSPPDPVELGCVPVVPCTNELPPTETLASAVPSNSTQSGLRNCQQLAAAGGCSSDLVVAG
ncbi:hypothetical protein HaLaN_23282, partial [Haematococcus lacustris]